MQRYRDAEIQRCRDAEIAGGKIHFCLLIKLAAIPAEKILAR
jgi:hypothetical protein